MKVFVVIEEEPESDYPSVVDGVFSSRENAERHVAGLESDRDADGVKSRDDLWWSIEFYNLDGGLVGAGKVVADEKE